MERILTFKANYSARGQVATPRRELGATHMGGIGNLLAHICTIDVAQTSQVGGPVRLSNSLQLQPNVVASRSRPWQPTPRAAWRGWSLLGDLVGFGFLPKVVLRTNDWTAALLSTMSTAPRRATAALHFSRTRCEWKSSDTTSYSNLRPLPQG